MKQAASLAFAQQAVRTSLIGQTTPIVGCLVAKQIQIATSRRSIHSTTNKSANASSVTASPVSSTRLAQSGETAVSALDELALSQVLRTYLITSISSSPTLLGASSSLLRRMLDSNGFLFSPEKNPVLRAVLWETFYLQFCAGETQEQVAKMCQDLRRQGFAGVILEYALEVLKDAEGDEEADVGLWRRRMLQTVDMAAEGDFVGLKWSGMGPAALRRMAAKQEPTPRMAEAMNALCKSAAAKDISLLPAAEETWSLEGYHSWSLSMQRLYNKQGKSVIYNTYQAYLRQAPSDLASHLAAARSDGFTLGIKLVRGAYLGSEVRDLIQPNIEATHDAYNNIMSALIHQNYNNTVKSVDSESARMPPINVVLATHNAVSVQKAQALRQAQVARGEALTPLAFAQLQGMADEVSCTLIASAKSSAGEEGALKERVFKCTTWGSMTECLNYLLRRAAENKDAASRTRDTREAMRVELARRMKGVFGMA